MAAIVPNRSGPLPPERIPLAEGDQAVAAEENRIPPLAGKLEPEAQLDLVVVVNLLPELFLPGERPYLARVTAAADRRENHRAAGQVQRIRGIEVLGRHLHEDLVLRSDRDAAAHRGDLDRRTRRLGLFRRRGGRRSRRGFPVRTAACGCDGQNARSDPPSGRVGVPRCSVHSPSSSSSPDVASRQVVHAGPIPEASE